jgi:predicted nucleotidyltransferase
MVSLAVTPLGRMFDEILDPSIRLRVAGLLVLFPEKEFTGREIAGLLGVSHSNVQRALRILVEDGLASKKRIGRADVFWTNRDHFAFKALRELFQVQRELPNRIARDLHSALRHAGVSVTVFGSYARGEADRGSDLDVLVIAKDRKALEDKIGGIETDFARRYGVPLSIKLFALSDMKRRPIPPYVLAAAKEGILISGVPIQKVLDPAE